MKIVLKVKTVTKLQMKPMKIFYLGVPTMAQWVKNLRAAALVAAEARD